MTNLDEGPVQVTATSLPILGGQELNECMQFIHGNGPAPAFCEFELTYIDVDGDGKLDLMEAKVRVKVPEPCSE